MGRLIRIDQYVKDAVEECPRAARDDNMLIGLVYERYLGEKKADVYGIRYCRENCEALKLPSPEAIIKARERVTKLYAKHKKE